MKNQKQKNQRKSKVIFFSLFGTVIIAIAVYLWCGVNLIEVSHYTVSSSKLPKSFDGYRIVQLTDLHSKSFGPGNKRLIDKIKGLKPDLIVVTGDMINSKNDSGGVFEKLAAALVKKYPVYCISGNHEEKADQKLVARFKEQLAGLGVHYLDNEKVQIIRGGDSISLYGLTVPLCCYGSRQTMKNDGITLTKDAITQRIGAADRTKFNLLLVHSPFFFGSCAAWGADLSLAGHVHGGVIRLPFIGGVISPDFQFFPQYDAGLFKKGNARMIVGRGLGTTLVSIRVLDQPEIVAITLKA